MRTVVFQHYQTLERNKEELLDRLGGLDPEVVVCAPRPGAWSPSQIGQHLMLSDEEVLRQMKAPRLDQRTIRDRLGLAMVSFVFRRGIRVKVPMESVVPSPGLSLAEIRERWNAIRSDMSYELDHVDDPDKLIFRHPIAGSMNVVQTLELAILHFRHHWRQMDRTLNALRK